METRKKQKTNEIKSWFFEKINIIDKSLATWTKKKDKTQIAKIKNESGVNTTNSTEIKRVI